jgi:hypothetical protein
MARSNNKDPKLSEVKAVLQRLQGFETEPDAAAQDAPAVQEGPGRKPRSGPAVAMAAVLLATAVGFLGGVYLFVRAMGPSPNPPVLAEGPTARTAAVPPRPPVLDAQEPAPPSPQRLDPSSPDIKAALEGARGLMAKGKVRAAREQLILLASKGSPDAAWDLARSYDPNVLAGVAADASPDVKEATRWYRTWYAAAVRDGLVADSVSLERIIGSMRP